MKMMNNAVNNGCNKDEVKHHKNDFTEMAIPFSKRMPVYVNPQKNGCNQRQ
jgi:hypothetical protein